MEGMILLFGSLARCLFDFGSTHSFPSPSFAENLDIAPIHVDIILSMATPLGVSIDTNLVYRGCTV